MKDEELYNELATEYSHFHHQMLIGFITDRKYAKLDNLQFVKMAANLAILIAEEREANK